MGQLVNFLGAGTSMPFPEDVVIFYFYYDLVEGQAEITTSPNFKLAMEDWRSGQAQSQTLAFRLQIINTPTGAYFIQDGRVVQEGDLQVGGDARVLTVELCTSDASFVCREPVMVWSLMIYGAAVAAAVAIPSLKSYMGEEKATQPPSLKEVIAGIQEKLGHN
eukprot:gene9726-7599_t